MLSRAWLLVLGTLLVAAAPGRDVDVVVSAGSPLDWLSDLSRPTPTRNRSVPGAETDHTTVAEQAPRVFSTDVYRFAKITTVDLIGEIPWTVRRETPTPGSGGTPTPGGAVSLPPPALSDDVLWLGLALLLKRTLHPALVGESEAEEYLVHLGEGALTAATMAKVDGLLDSLCASVLSKAGPAPAPSPLPPRGKTVLDAMLHRLTVEDLTCAYPFALDGKFAARVSILGEEMFGHVLESTRSKHPFLRRNATLLLARYPSPSAADRLRELLEDKDPVVQVRALDALARRKDRASVPAILALYKKNAPWPTRLSLIRALGILGEPQALDTVRAHLKANPADYDSTGACVTALARLTGKGNDEHFKLLDQVGNLAFADPRSNYQPVQQDPAGTRTAVLRQLVLLARARAGHAPSADQVLARMPAGPAFNPPALRGGMRSPLLAAWHAPVVYPLLETLRSIPKGDLALFRIAADRSEDLSVRVRALAELGRLNPPALGENLRKLVSDEEEFSVASVALHVLAALAGPQAVEAAQSQLAGYGPRLSPPRKALVAEAVKVLASKNALDAAPVARIVEFEIIAHERGLNRKPDTAKPNPPPNPFGPGVPLDFESPVQFIEEIVVALGRSQETWARSLLRDVLSSPGMPGRAEAAVALAAARDASDGPALLAALKDKDPWVRFMAYRSLKFVLAKDAPCDWIYGSETHRGPSVGKYAQWVKEALNP